MYSACTANEFLNFCVKVLGRTKKERHILASIKNSTVVDTFERTRPVEINLDGLRDLIKGGNMGAVLESLVLMREQMDKISYEINGE